MWNPATMWAAVGLMGGAMVVGIWVVIGAWFMLETSLHQRPYLKEPELLMYVCDKLLRIYQMNWTKPRASWAKTNGIEVRAPPKMA